MATCHARIEDMAAIHLLNDYILWCVGEKLFEHSSISSKLNTHVLYVVQRTMSRH